MRVTTFLYTAKHVNQSIYSQPKCSKQSKDVAHQPFIFRKEPHPINKQVKAVLKR